MKIKIILLALFIIHYSLFITPTLAQEASKSATSSPSASLQQKLDDLKKQIASKAAALKQEVNKKMQNKAVAGEVIEKNSTKLILKTLKGNRSINLNEYTEYKSAKNKSLTEKNIVSGSYIVALGDMDEKNTLTAKRIILEEKSPLESQVVWGKVTKIGDNYINIFSKDNEELIILTSNSTKYLLGKEEAGFTDIKNTDALTVIFNKQNENFRNANFIYIIPVVGHFKPENSKTSTPSATTSAKPKN